MKRTIIIAAAGLVLSSGGFAAAQAAPVSESMSSPSSSRGADCSNYPGSVYTMTTLRFGDSHVKRGQHNDASVRVRSTGRMEAKGSVGVTLERTSGAGGTVRLYAHLGGGRAHVSIPRRLAAGLYAARAEYFPDYCSRWAASRSGVEFLKVSERRHHGHHHHNR